jgi:hypothetical protein
MMSPRALCSTTLMIALCLAQVRIGAATISGIVVDKESGNGIAGASVKIEGTSVEQKTDSQGAFALEYDGPVSAIHNALQIRRVHSAKSELKVYTMKGRAVSLIRSNDRRSMGRRLLSDGIYIIESCRGAPRRCSRFLPAGKPVLPGSRAAEDAQGLAKTCAQIVTLVVSKAGYHGKIQDAEVGATDVRIEMVKIQTSGSFPDASTTGIRGAGLSYSDLTPVSGGLKVSDNGAIIDKKDIRGAVVINADNVTLKRSRIRGSGTIANLIMNNGSNFIIEYCEVEGLTDGVGNGIGRSNFTARYCDIHRVGDGAKINGNATVEHCYVHDLRKWQLQSGTTHNDCLQATRGSNIVVRNNRLHGIWQNSTSCIKITAEKGPVSNATIEGNYLAGGGYCVYVTKKDPYSCPLGVKLLNNTFQKNSYTHSHLQTKGCSVTFSGNVFVTGSPY